RRGADGAAGHLDRRAAPVPPDGAPRARPRRPGRHRPEAVAVGQPDVIELRGLRLAGIVGVLPHEQAQAQPLELDLDISLDLAPAGASDDLADTVDYGALCDAAELVV